MIREVRNVATQAAVGQTFACSLTPPNCFRWEVQSIHVEVPNYVSGALSCRVTKDGAYVAGSDQGQNDTAGGGALRVHAGETLTARWDATRVAANGKLNGILELVVDEVPVGELVGG